MFKMEGTVAMRLVKSKLDGTVQTGQLELIRILQFVHQSVEMDILLEMKNVMIN